MKRQNNTHYTTAVWRLNLVRIAFVAMGLGLAWWVTDIEVLDTDFLRHQGDARHIRKVPDVAYRGMIVDRNGEPLAVSTPVQSIWFNPQELTITSEQMKKLARILGISVKAIKTKISKGKKKEFVYLKRHVPPEIKNKVKALNITGVASQREYKRYYPAGEVSSQVIGFTSIDDHGQEGLELTYDAWLKGIPGLKRMVRDGRGNYVGGGEQLKATKPGKNITLSIDIRLQYLAYQALKSAVDKHHARSATAVILDIKTGEILAMVNQPSFNPNNRRGVKSSDYRNRAVTDLFEPGSTMKPFTVASGLKSGKYTPETMINTHPGTFRVGGHTIKDFRDYGEIDVSTMIQKSSNVAASKMALSLKPKQFWNDFAAFGFGETTGAYFPGEAIGYLPDPDSWRKLDRAALSYGYGLATTALQLARGYMIIANGGISRPLSFIKLDEVPEGHRVFAQADMSKIIKMMRRVVSLGGTARKASVDNYHVAGKSGTVKKARAGGYTEKQYLSLFSGVIPATNPRLTMVVMVDDPKGSEYYGGLVAAPVFAETMVGAMRLLNIAPDNLPETQLQLVKTDD